MADDTTLGTSTKSALDDITASGEQTATTIAKVDAAAAKAKSTFMSYEQTLIDTKEAIGSTTNAFDNFIETFQTTQKLSEQQVNQFNLLSTAILGYRKSFEGIDLKGSGFMDQIKYIQNLGNTPSGIGMLSGLITNTFGKAIPDSIKGSFHGLLSFASQLALSADNALRLQTHFINLSAATGNLGRVYQVAGSDLSNMNELLLRQKEMIGAAAKSTFLSTDSVEKYYSALGAIPGALESMVTGTYKSGTQMNMLTAAIKLSQGSGREFNTIINDLSVAFKNYGLTGESALKFSSRMGDVANNLGIELSTVTSHLHSAASAFTRFADAGEAASKMSEGLAKITNDYVQALKASGMSGDHAIEVVRGMTDAISGMNIQQKAFLSGQTGGPGGLMGAFQIEKMMREGNIEGVMKKMRDQMRQQFGKIVTLDEAASSQGAAAQMTRQIALLKSGPLGSMVKTDQDAYKMLESFKKMDEGIKITGLSTKSLQSTMDKGTMLQQSMATDLGVIRSVVETQQGLGDITSLKLTQGFTGKTSKFAAGAAEAGGYGVQHYAAGIKSGMLDKAGSDILVGNIHKFQEAFKSIAPNIASAIDHMQKALMNPSEAKAIKEDTAKLEEQIKIQKAQLAKMPKEKQAAMKKEIAAEEELLGQAKKLLATGGAPKFPAPGTGIGSTESAYAPGEALGTVATAAVGGAPGAAAKPKVGTSGAAYAGGPIPVTGSIEVKVHAICVNCGKEDAQGHAMHPIKSQ